MVVVDALLAAGGPVKKRVPFWKGGGRRLQGPYGVNLLPSADVLHTVPSAAAE